jgi:hypothetical protein
VLHYQNISLESNAYGVFMTLFTLSFFKDLAWVIQYHEEDVAGALASFHLAKKRRSLDSAASSPQNLIEIPL